MTPSEQSTGARRWTSGRAVCERCRRRLVGRPTLTLCLLCRQAGPGERLWAARLLSLMTIAELAELAGVTPKAIEMAELSGHLDSRARWRVCKALGVSGFEIWPEIYSRFKQL